MNPKVVAGSLFAFAYNCIIANFPSRTLRSLYLKAYLASYQRGTAVQMGCKFLNGRKIYLGKRNVINSGCFLDGRRYSIRTGSDVSIGPEAAILTLGHDPQSSTFADKGGDVVIGDYVWICFRAIILPGIKVGDGSVVAAGAVVTRDVEPFTIVAGNPARPIGKRNPDLVYRCHFNPWLL